ncbi:MAG: efflux RND transporter permease subunit [Candidatus Riflebacteria bacterium]|nr:efflux RND transporter permease subunit [Candidatus Riflebacteria bacterium]
MKLADLCIQRPVFATMLVSALVVLGTFSYRELGVDLFPKIEFPYVVVTTRFPGAGPVEVESQVTKVIEEAVNTVSGIDELRSTSYESLSQVVIAFQLSRNAGACAQDVRDRLGRVQSKLPQGVEPPVIEKIDPDASPVLSVVVSAPVDPRELTEIARKQVKEPIESVLGVGQVSLVGGRLREIHVSLDADALRAHGLTPVDVKTALQRQNVEVPGGLVETGPTDLVVRTLGRVRTVEQFGDVVVREVAGALVRIRDVATVVDTRQEQRTLARLDGTAAVALLVQKQSGSNTVDVVRAVKARLQTLLPTLPKGATLTTIRDQSRFILASFHAVMEHLVLGAILASFVVLLFLKDARTTVMVALSIPTSIISTFSLMWLMGFTLNSMTLLALTLAVGLVIDDAIVVHENAFRHMEELGKPRRKAASDAAREIGLAVMATTFSLVVIFVPVAFIPGIIGRFLGSFGLTMAFSIMVSLFVSFTLTPMLCGHFLKVHQAKGESRHSWFDRLFEACYIWLLERSMNRRWVVVGLSLACVLATVPLFKRVGMDFVPADDQSEFSISVKLREGASLAQTSRVLAQVEESLRRQPTVEKLLATIGDQAGTGSNEGQIYVGMVDLARRKSSQSDLMRQTREILAQRFPDLITTVSPINAIGGGGKHADLMLSLQGPDLEVLKKLSSEVVAKLRKTPGLVDVDSSQSAGKPELDIDVDRERAAALGLDVLDVASTIRTLVGGDEEQVTRFRDEVRGEEYEVRVRLQERFRNRPELVAQIPIRSREGLLPLGAVAQVRSGLGPTQIGRYNRQRQVMILANLQGLGLSEAQTAVERILADARIPSGYSAGFLGKGKNMGELVSGFVVAFLLSTVFMYMILAGQFESFVHPITILLSLPLCIPFGVLALVLAGERLNLWSMLGLFMLFGIVKKNAILQVDYTNALRETGMDRLKAILQANATRLRPILMTTLTLIAGMIPMALSTGPGAGSRRGMAIVVIGGQTLCLLITLLLTPVAYSLFDDLVNSRLLRRLRSMVD